MIFLLNFNYYKVKKEKKYRNTESQSYKEFFDR